MDTTKLITAAVVFGGLAALALAQHFGAPNAWLALGFSVLTIVAGSLHSMVMGAPKS